VRWLPALHMTHSVGARVKLLSGPLRSFYTMLSTRCRNSKQVLPAPICWRGGRLDEYFTRTDSSNNVSSLLTDLLGSPIGLVGSAQTIATNYTYQPFGATTVGGAANGSSYQFTGRENDGTGLYFYRARYYSPTLQRFIAQDPIGFAGGDADLYSYVWNEPPNFIDPSGLLGGGLSLGGSGEGGSGTQTAAGTAGMSGGVFVSSDTGQISVGVTATAGGSSGPPGTQASLPPGSNNSAAGGSIGGGLSGFVTNANCPNDLSGPFQTTTSNVGFGPFQVSFQVSFGYNSVGKPIIVVSVSPPGAGMTLGAGQSVMTTDTEVVWSRNLGAF
jgi:RHS repeat-associated protein